MGIFDALNTSVGGLQAQSFALQNISGNIANASTTGYKGITTSFEDLIPDATTPDRQVAGGVTGFAQATITTQGTVSASTVATNMAINGDGFFSVQKATNIVDNVPVFSGATDYTRRGDFQLNSNGNLINGAGYYLMGITVDPKTGNPTGSVPQVLQFQNNFVPAQATTAIQYAANLPTTPATPASSTATAGTIQAAGGLSASDFSVGNSPLPIGQSSYTSGTYTGAAVNNNLTVPAPIDPTTTLSGGANSNSLSTPFVNGDSITLTSSSGVTETLSFTNGATSGNSISVNDTVATLLSKISAITGGTAASVSAGGAITLNTASGLGWTITGSHLTASLGIAGPLPRQLSTVATTSVNGAVTASDLTTFTNESISGGAVTVYNSAGTPINLQLRWAKTDSSTLGTGHQDIWNLFYQANSSGSPAWVNTGTNYVFNANGSLQSPAASAVNIPNVTVDQQALGNLSLNLGTGALTQFATTSGTTTINTITQNGFAAGQLQSVAVNNSGLVVGTFSNGQNLDLAQVTLSHFNGTNYLKALDGGAYQATDLSGPAIIGASGKISGSSLEGSNTDIADEFTKLIVTQQAYSANTKVITTANSMVQDLLNVLR
jgi:flagellar hook protein FlgE